MLREEGHCSNRGLWLPVEVNSPGEGVQGQKLKTSELVTALVLERDDGGPGQAGGQGGGGQWADCEGGANMTC